MSTRAIPKIHAELIALAHLALAATESLGDSIGLLQNTAPRLRQDLASVTGESDPDAPAGTQDRLNEARGAVGPVQVIRREAMAEGRAFCAAAVDLLKISLGRRWNPRWEAAGFTRHSLAIPHHPLLLLLDLRNYLRAHPERENTPLEITAERADTLATALQLATDNVVAGVISRQSARKSRDAALRKLAARLRGLRNELEQLLAPDDIRWRRFGFSRPIDRRQPERVAEITVQPGLPGSVTVSWPAVVRADDYRLTWQREGSAEPATELPLIADPTFLLSDLPSGVAVLITVTARNRAGESRPTSVRAIVP